MTIYENHKWLEEVIFHLFSRIRGNIGRDLGNKGSVASWV
jgi:hypothetical protein